MFEGSISTAKCAAWKGKRQDHILFIEFSPMWWVNTSRKRKVRLHSEKYKVASIDTSDPFKKISCGLDRNETFTKVLSYCFLIEEKEIEERNRINQNLAGFEHKRRVFFANDFQKAVNKERQGEDEQKSEDDAKGAESTGFPGDVDSQLGECLLANCSDVRKQPAGT